VAVPLPFALTATRASTADVLTRFLSAVTADAGIARVVDRGTFALTVSALGRSATVLVTVRLRRLIACLRVPRIVTRAAWLQRTVNASVFLG
jgi:hypothetical protein